MDSRLLRFGRSKRGKTVSHEPAPDFQTVPYDSTSVAGTKPIFIHQPLGKSAREAKRLEEQGLLLKGVAYDALPPGRAPQFGDRPQKGNGPVKLQTSRRLSSGELEATTQDNRRTLEDIREGEYIVGRKERRESASPSPAPSYAPSTGTAASRPTTASVGRWGQVLRSRPGTARSTRTARTERDVRWSLTPVTPATPATPTSPTSLTSPTSPTSPPSLASPTSPTRSLAGSAFPAETSGLGIVSPSSKSMSDRHDVWQDARPPSSAQSPQGGRGRDDQNATIAALWKAEYGRLVKIYGHQGVTRDVLQSVGSPLTRRLSQAPSSPAMTPPIALALQPLPLPLPGLDAVVSKRSSGGSTKSSLYRDDTSDFSSYTRASMSSSTYTTPTSVGEGESPTTREDIRKMIEDMRSNYLHAIEVQSPPMVKKKSTKKRRKPKLGASPQLDTKSGRGERQTWHGHHPAGTVPGDDQPRPRVASHPVQGYGRLSPIEASPSRSDSRSSTTSPRDLKRADSMTLGSLVDHLPTAPPAREARAAETAADAQNPSTPVDAQDADWLKLTFPAHTYLTLLTRDDHAEKPASTASGSSSAVPRPNSGRTPPQPPPSLAELVNFI